jgi:hypothetical protein
VAEDSGGGLGTAAAVAFAPVPNPEAAMVAAATPAPVEVRLGTHAFGALTPPDAVVARVDAAGVGWVEGAEGDSAGPWSFEVAADGTVWLLDEVNERLLGSRVGQFDRVVPLPVGVVEFAGGPNGIFFVSTHPPGEPMRLAAVTADGRLLWRAPLASQNFNNALRMGPDGVLYDVEPGDRPRWLPVVDAAGRPMSVADQNRLARRDQPLPGGRRLIVRAVSEHEVAVVQSDAAGRPVRHWRITGDTAMAPTLDTPALAGGDPVVTLDVFDWTRPRRPPGWNRSSCGSATAVPGPSCMSTTCSSARPGSPSTGSGLTGRSTSCRPPASWA